MKWIYEKVDSSGIAIKTLNPEHAEWCVEYRDNVSMSGKNILEYASASLSRLHLIGEYTITFKDIEHFILFKMTFSGE